MTQSPSRTNGNNVIRVCGLLSLALGVFGLLVGSVVMYTSFQGQLDSQQASTAAQNQAREIGDSLAEIQAAIENPEVVGIAQGLLREGRQQSEALRAAVQRRGVTNIIDLKVFPVEVESIELGEYPEPDFAVIEMLLQARAEGKAPIQVHYAGLAIENLALAEAVEVDAGVEGVIFLRVPVSMASSLLAVSSFIDALAIVQGQGEQAHVIRSFGQLSGPIEVTPIPGSRLSLQWTRRTFASSFSKQSAIIILSIGTILLMIGLLIRQRFGVLEAHLKRPFGKKSPAEADDRIPAPGAVAKKKPRPSKAAGSAASRRKPRPSSAAVKKKESASPPVDDLPDWLLDSDEIDQSDAPLGGSADDLPDLPDTLGDGVDDTVGVEKPDSSSEEDPVADTVFFEPDEDDLFAVKETQDLEAEKDGADTDSEPDSFEGSSERESTEPGKREADREQSAADDGVSPPIPEDSKGAEAAARGASDSEIDWDDFNSDIEQEELLIESDEQAIDAALAELEESKEESPDSNGSESPDAADVVDEAGSSEQASDRDQSTVGETDDRGSGEPVLDPGLFRANGIGGTVGEQLDSRAATLIGEAIGSEARSRGVDRMVVGRDGRLDGPILMSALSQGLRSAGVDVVDIGAAPIPVLNYAASELTSGSGVMVTGSHHAVTHNGFRIRIQNELLSDGGIQAIRKRIDSQDLSSGSGQLEEESVIERYIERIGSDIQLERALKVVVDCGNGIAGSVVPAALGAIGADVIPLYADVDGSFPNHLPDPSQPDNLEDLKLCVRNFNADLGLAFDGDGDRLAAVGADGQVVWTDRVLMLLAPDILERNAGARVVIDSASSNELSELIQAAGGKPVVERSAEAFVEHRMRKESALLGGLFSGHLFIAERWYPFDDAIYASARLLEVLAADTRPITEIIEQLPEAEGTPELRIALAPERAEELITELIAEGDFGDAELSMVDGLRADYPDGWGMVRASHQGRGLVLRFEAESSKALKRIMTTFNRQITARESDARLPF